MVNRTITAFTLVLLIASYCPAAAQKGKRSSKAATEKAQPKFLDAIEVASSTETVTTTSKATVPEPQFAVNKERIFSDNNAIESATEIQLKYSVLLDTEVEQIQNTALFSAIDEWFGTPYVLGGSTKDGIDCSAFVQVMYSKLFQISMPRTAKEQYKLTKPVSRAELREGDLIFFKTRGSSVSHVGIYLQNNKFVHAATSGGVMVSDLFEAYWIKHFMGVGRCEPQAQTIASTPKP